MKKSFLLFSLLLIAFSGFSQEKQKTIGVQVSPGIYKHRFLDKFQIPITSGFFYSHDLSRRSGFMTGIQVTH